MLRQSFNELIWFRSATVVLQAIIRLAMCYSQSLTDSSIVVYIRRNGTTKAWRNLIIHVSAEVILHVSQSSRVADAVDRRHQSFKLKSWRCRRPGKEGAVRPSLLVSDEQARAGCEARTAVLHSALVISGTSYIAFEATPINLGMIVCPSTRFVHYRCWHRRWRQGQPWISTDRALCRTEVIYRCNGRIIPRK